MLVYLIIDTLIYIISETIRVDLFIDFLDIDWTFLIIRNHAVFIWNTRLCVFCTSECERLNMLLTIDPMFHYATKIFLTILEICFLNIFLVGFKAFTKASYSQKSMRCSLPSDIFLKTKRPRKFLTLLKFTEYSCPCLFLFSGPFFGYHFFPWPVLVFSWRFAWDYYFN